MTTVTSETDLATSFGRIDPTITANQQVMLIGPDYVARKYTDPAFKSTLLVGNFTGTQLVVNWPGLLAGETPDLTFTRVFAENCAQRYYNESALPMTDSGSILANQTNRVRIPSRTFATTAGGTRSSQVPGDVVVGDWVRVTNGSKSVTAKVAGLIGDVVAATVQSSPSATTSNVAAPGGTSTVSPGGTNTSTAVSTVTGLSNPTNYNGLAARQPTETYILTVTAVGAAGTGIAGNWSTVTLSCVSASGTDPAQSGLVPVVGTPLAIGSRGARVQFSHGVSGNDWVLNDTYTVVVTQSYAIPTTAAAGTYTGTVATNYIVRVTTGGLSGAAQVSVSTSSGVDVSGPSTITTAVPLAIGTKGVTFTATGTQFFANDSWTVAVTPQAGGVTSAGGPVHTLVLDQSLETTAALVATNWTGQNIQVELAILENLEITAKRYGAAPALNWVGTTASLTLNAGLGTQDPRMGSLVMPVVQGNMFVHYRALRSQYANQVISTMVPADVIALGLPKDDPDNVLAYAIYRAQALLGNVPVKACPVASDDLAGYTAVEPYIVERPDWNTLVSLSLDPTIRARAIAMVTSTGPRSLLQMPSTTVVPVSVASTQAVIQLRADGVTVSTATVSDNPMTGPVDYVLVNDGSGQFVVKGVLPGDLFRISYVDDGFNTGTTLYSTYTVASVTSDQSLLLVAGPASAISVASRYEIWRNITVANQVTAAIATANAFNDSRVIPVFPDLLGNNGVNASGPQVCASVAGMRAAAPPHAGLVTLQLSDWTDCPASTTFAGYHATLETGGMYVIRRLYTGQVVIDSAYTSLIGDPDFKYDSVRRTYDSCLWYFRQVFEQFRGSTNMVDQNLALMATQFQAAIDFIKARSVVPGLGSMIITGSLNSVRRHAILLDRVVVSMSLTLPGPVNSIEFDIDLTV